MVESVARPASAPVDYQLAAIGIALLGSVLVGVASAVPLRVAAGGGSLFSIPLVALCLARFP
jgi:hypothetical protein